MNLQHLRYFLTLADLEHYTEAARQLHITQPTLSHAIMMLEEELTVSLFTKRGRNIVLTKAGREFYATVQSSLAILDNGIRQLQRNKRNQITLNLSLLRVLGRKAIPNLVRCFLDEHPTAQINFDFHNDSGMSSDLINGVATDQYDVAFCSKLDHYPNISYLPIFVQDLVVIVPKNHPLAKQKGVTLEDTLPFPQVWFSKRSGIRPVIEQLYEKINGKPQIVFEVSEDETVAGLVAQGFGLAIIPKFDFLNNFDDIQIVEVDNLKKARIYYAAYRNDILPTPELALFLDFLRIRSTELSDIC